LFNFGSIHPFPIVFRDVFALVTHNKNKKNGELDDAYDVEGQY
jgi:hypothetical protein